MIWTILKSVRRGLLRMVLLAGVGVLNLLVSYTPEIFGLQGDLMALLAPLCYQTGRVFLGLAAGDLALRILQPRVDSQEAANAAMDIHTTGPGLVYIGHCILRGIILLLTVTAARAEAPPAAALPLLPVLKAEQRAWWPDMPLPSTLGAQVEQETCITLKHRMCWNPRAELRTSREQGVGLGQLTRAFRADGSTRFDALGEIVQAYPSPLAGLSWDNRYDATLQLRAVVLKGLQGYKMVLGAASTLDRLAMSKAAYNGGSGGLASDRRMCAATQGCDSRRWFGHVERTSAKAKVAVKGYGKSFFEINREYVRNVMVVRRVRYLSLDTP